MSRGTRLLGCQSDGGLAGSSGTAVEMYNFLQSSRGGRGGGGGGIDGCGLGGDGVL